ncbi:MAG: GNAT family N-acetyltransferase [Acetobacter okinawensis]|uniref:GNAT family N-acetyltransferase n=1 Tax=Acetobacter okinawensis TaxID=1076594 RepID=UPI0039EB1DDA
MIYLQPLTENDLHLTLEWRNDDSIRKWFKTSDTFSLAQHHTWFSMRRDDPNDLIFIAKRVSDSQSVGQVSLYNIDPLTKTAEVGRFISAPNYAGNGYMKNACQILLDMAFNKIGLQNIFLEVFSNNTRAINLYKNLGFSYISTTNDLDRYEMTIDHWRQKN